MRTPLAWRTPTAQHPVQYRRRPTGVTGGRTPILFHIRQEAYLLRSGGVMVHGTWNNHRVREVDDLAGIAAGACWVMLDFGHATVDRPGAPCPTGPRGALD